MYEKFRNDVIASLTGSASTQEINKLISAMDAVAVRYEVKPLDLSIVPYTYELPELINTYVVCRSVEGLSRKTLEHYYLTRMKKSDINWDKCEVNVLGMGSKYRTCFLNAKAIVALRRYLATQDDDNEHVFVTDRSPHHSITKEGLERIVRIINNLAGANVSTRITPHVFRHTTATVALQNGMPVQDVQTMLGHANINTTMIYAEVNLRDVKTMHTRCVV